MKPVLIAGIIIVNLALLSYSVAIITQNRTRKISGKVKFFLSFGVAFDIISTICMIIGSGKILTIHGVIGYLALAGMLSDTVMSFRFVKTNGYNSTVPQKLNRLSLIAYLYWIIAYVTGALLIMLR